MSWSSLRRVPAGWDDHPERAGSSLWCVALSIGRRCDTSWSGSLWRRLLLALWTRRAGRPVPVGVVRFAVVAATAEVAVF
jgi:hypothetical protein